ncbi:endolytic transglycosylase MltG [Natranaerofaba carboxydovora]|uniref:endolytic transglycosylase MltG n=1 Tax=Natranaerofaba carboxydovora TaxID=2742683 RepID=UPI001F13ECD5|nr:endolytic transglycosylase MltG [Natranaerofaba carboxydovora]UMZ73392.1 hypothetical protein ACONDI_00946 [Natranaerofaba carboxydovora]
MKWDAKVVLGIGIGLILASAMFFVLDHGEDTADYYTDEKYESLRWLSNGNESHNILEDDAYSLDNLEIENNNDSEDSSNGNASDYNNEEISFEIPEGSRASEVVELLLEKDLIEDKEEFSSKLEDKRLTRRIVYGSYEVSTDIDNDTLLSTITN